MSGWVGEEEEEEEEGQGEKEGVEEEMEEEEEWVGGWVGEGGAYASTYVPRRRCVASPRAACAHS